MVETLVLDPPGMAVGGPIGDGNVEICTINCLSLFSGIGGIEIGIRRALPVRTICYVESDEYCQSVLIARIRDGILDDAPIWDDIRTFDGRPWRGIVDLITAGFPCQPWSVAGPRKGMADKRNLWPDTIRVIREVVPAWLVLENVRGLLVSGYFGRVLQDLAMCGYDALWRVLSAAEVGAPHKRDRIWIIGHANNVGESTGAVHDRETPGVQTDAPDVADPDGRVVGDEHICTQERKTTSVDADFGEAGFVAPSPNWPAPPGVLGVDDGIPHRLDRLSRLGNAVVPPVAEALIRLGFELDAELRG